MGGPRLLDTSAAFLFAGSTNSEEEHVSHTHTHEYTALTLLDTQMATGKVMPSRELTDNTIRSQTNTGYRQPSPLCPLWLLKVEVH